LVAVVLKILKQNFILKNCTFSLPFIPHLQRILIGIQCLVVDGSHIRVYWSFAQRHTTRGHEKRGRKCAKYQHLQSGVLMVEVEFGAGNENGGQRQTRPHATLEVEGQQLLVLTTGHRLLQHRRDFHHRLVKLVSGWPGKQETKIILF
jgi:hypothetical protein